MNIFDNILAQDPISWNNIVINIVIAFVLGFLISLVYQWTHRGFSYSISFIHTLILLCMIISVVMMVIGSNIARAFSLVGALSIIRFRTVVKDTRDTAFVFFSLAIGMATGTGSHKIAIIGTVLISLIILMLNKFGVGSTKGNNFLLKFRVRSSPAGGNPQHQSTLLYQDVFKKYLRKNILINVTTIRDGSSMELAFSIKFKDADKQQQFISELKALDGIENAMIIFDEEGMI